MGIWYYVDVNHQRQGPVTPEELALAYRRGAVNRDTLVWREGLPQWAPLEQHLGELPTLPEAPAIPASTGPGEPADASLDTVVDAGFVRRLGAYLIDAMLIGSVFYVVFLVVLLATAAIASARPGGEEAFLVGLAIAYLIYPVLSLAYYAGMESSKLQATVGKLALGIKVVDAQGRRLGLGRAAGRWAGSLLSYLSLYIGFLMAGWTRRKQALHDLVARTYVVDKWAYTDQPGRQVRELNGCLVAVVAGVVVLMVLGVLGILAAIAVPAYQDYVLRSRIAVVLAEGEAAAGRVDAFRAETDRCPRDAAEAGIGAPDHPDIQEIMVIEGPDGTCELAVALSGEAGLRVARRGVIYLRQDPDGGRFCEASGIPGRALPTRCQ